MIVDKLDWWESMTKEEQRDADLTLVFAIDLYHQAVGEERSS